MPRTSVTFLLLLVVSLLAHAWPDRLQAQAVPPEFEITPAAGMTAFAANHVGDFIVAWSENGQWFARIYESASGALGPALALPESSREHPPWEVSSVALGSDRSFVVGRWGWLSSGLGTGSSARVFDANGVALGGDIDVGGFDAHPPNIKMDGTGRFLITYGQTCWLGPQGCGPMEAVHGIRYGGFGSPGRYLFRVDDKVGVHVSLNASGAFVLSWTSPTRSPAFIVRVVSHDDVVAPDRELVRSGSKPILWSRSYLNDDGSFTAVWSTNAALYGRHYSTAGSPLGPAFEFEDIPGASIAPEPAGLILFGNQAPIGASAGLFARRYGFTGAPRGPAFQVHVDVGGGGGFRGAASLPGGAFVVIWKRAGAIYGRIFDATTGLVRSSWSDVKTLYRR